MKTIKEQDDKDKTKEPTGQNKSSAGPTSSRENMEEESSALFGAALLQE